jgi:glycosyltransferase involved in cell wall biosynthesis
MAKIYITCSTMEYLSGSPLYNYTLARELVRLGHDVTLKSVWSDNYLQRDLLSIGVKQEPEGEYDLALISQNWTHRPPAKKTINIVHSEYECENPVQDLEHYVAIRPSIKEHLVKKHGIKPSKIKVIYNGVDLERFKPRPKPVRQYTKIVIPATIDHLRQKMFDYYANKASYDYQIHLYGKHFGANIPTHPHIHLHPETDNIEDAIGDADIVAGILLGRVNLEARAMNVLSYIHNPDKPEEYEAYYPHRWDFDDKHDIKKVAERLLEYGRQ